MTITKGRVIANSPAVLLARVAGISGVILRSADVQSIVVKVFESEDPETFVQVTPNVGSSVFDTLQTDARWTQDADGYNVALSMPATCWPARGRYQAEAYITPTGGNAFYLIFDLQAAEIFSA